MCFLFWHFNVFPDKIMTYKLYISKEFGNITKSNILVNRKIPYSAKKPLKQPL